MSLDKFQKQTEGMSYYDQLEVATIIVYLGTKQGQSLEWIREQIPDELQESAFAMAFNGLFGKRYEGDA